MSYDLIMKRASSPVPKAKKPSPKKASKPAAEKPRAELQEYISSVLDGDKAQDIVCIPLKGKTTIADYMLIATGTSSRHVAGMAQKLRDRLSADRKIKARVEGLEAGDWAIIDAGDVMVHLFREEVREFYDLEKLWGADFSMVNYTRYQSV
jgi:ribosome-associated protein